MKRSTIQATGSTHSTIISDTDAAMAAKPANTRMWPTARISLAVNRHDSRNPP